MHPNVHSSTIYNSQVLEATCVPISKWVDQKLWYIYTMEFYTAERKKELLSFGTAWMELESIMVREVSQVVKDKYHVISPISEPNQQNKQANKL